ncbi:MAG: PIN domain-containing protein [Mangrovibacterium sp.]
MKDLMFDTSIWIDFFKGEQTDEVILLTDFLENNLPVYTCPTIIQEVLQGIINETQYLKVKEDLLSLEIIIADPVDAAIGAADIYRGLRKKGITIRKSNDCLIAYYARIAGVDIVHHDRDFDLILENS